MEKLLFILRAKRKLLNFYDLGVNRQGIPLASLEVRIDEWINLLKGFTFFDQRKITTHVEKFKRCVAEINPEIITINGYTFTDLSLTLSR